MSSADANIPGYVRFAIAGLSGCGASFPCQPFDLIKYRMQLSGKGGSKRLYRNFIHAGIEIIKAEGIMGVFNGLSASIFRQLTLTMVRMGMYSALVDKFTEADGTPPSIFLQCLAGVISGGIGAIVGNPADIALVKMATDGARPPDQRENYKHVFDTIQRICKKDGIGGLWIGWEPSTIRCMILNVTQIVLYKNTKVFLLEKEILSDNAILHIICGTWTAFASAVATAPIDITKTRLMTMQSKQGKPEYSGMIEVAQLVIKQEGFFSLWKGVTPTFWRILPNNFVIFILIEFFTKSYKKYVLGDKSGSGF